MVLGRCAIRAVVWVHLDGERQHNFQEFQRVGAEAFMGKGAFLGCALDFFIIQTLLGKKEMLSPGKKQVLADTSRSFS
jgi:hypothetical protein